MTICFFDSINGIENKEKLFLSPVLSVEKLHVVEQEDIKGTVVALESVKRFWSGRHVQRPE